MGKLLELALYNPSRLGDEDFLAGFVARIKTAERIVTRLRQIKLGGLAQHRLIVGQRGMGKTTLLRRIALEVRRDPELSAVMIPLSFREEQYNVHSLHVLWCNCLDALGDYFEESGQFDKARELDEAIINIEHTDDLDGNRALDLFRSWFKREGRRPLLLIDNLDIVLDGLSKDEWNLRRVMQQAGGIVLVGASTRALEAAVHPEAAFYEFFQVDLLQRLELDEVMACLLQLSSLRGEPGSLVQRLLANDPARIEVLHDLTGGNPRTLAMLYLVLEAADHDDVMVDLERLLDQATPLYKARVEELAPQARVVFDAVALSWDPITAADLATGTALGINSVSTQLDRLVRDGIVEKTSLSSTRRAGFQVAERFFNIWYLMRHGPRRQRQRLKWLAEMLKRIYTPTELEQRARRILSSQLSFPSGHAKYCLAISDALDESPLSVSLARQAFKADPKLCDETESEVSWLQLKELLQHQPRNMLFLISSCYKSYSSEMTEFSKSVRDDLKIVDECFSATPKLSAASNPDDTKLDPTSPDAWNRLAGRLERQGYLSEAETVYVHSLTIDRQRVKTHASLAYLLIGQGRILDAKPHYLQALLEMPPHGARLLRAFRYLAHSELDAALSEMGFLLTENHPELFTSYREDFLRFLRLAVAKGHGNYLADWVNTAGLRDRYRPVWVAYDAYLHGQERLRDVNPEVRAGARRLLQELAGDKHSRVSSGVSAKG